MRAAIYCRTSKGEAGDPNLATQLLQVRQYVAKRGWEAVDYTDAGTSRSKSRRDGLDALREAARRREIDVVVVPALDRLVGSLPQLVAIMQELDALDLKLVSLREAVDSTTPAGKALLQMAAVFSEFERSITRSRIMAGLDRARSQGKKLGRPRANVDLNAARRLLDEGQAQRRVARVLGVSRSALRRALKRAEIGVAEPGA